MLFAFVYSVVRLFFDVLDVRLRVRNSEAELLLLRHQLRVVRRQLKWPQLDIADRTIMAALSGRVSSAALVGMLVQPETVLGWHRALVRRRWAAYGRRRGPGRPSLDAEVQKLILGIASENPKWGCVRIRGELLQARSPRLGGCDSQVAATEPDRSGATKIRFELEGVPASPGLGNRADRLPQPRTGLAHRASGWQKPLPYNSGAVLGDHAQPSAR